MIKLKIGDKVKAKHPYRGEYEIIGIFQAWAWCARLVHITWDFPTIPLGDLVKIGEASDKKERDEEVRILSNM